MIVIGGIGRAEGAVVGTLLVTYIYLWFTDPKRILVIGLLMLAAVLFTRGGLFGLPDQFREMREKRKAERIAKTLDETRGDASRSRPRRSPTSRRSTTGASRSSSASTCAR